MKPERFALDRASLRSKDVDNRLHVASANISKAMVCPYFGREIPDSEALGLQPDKVYYLLRDAAELEAAAPTFNNLPLLFDHAIVTAADPKQERVVGTTGTDTVFEAPYLKTSLAIWVGEAIAAVESGEYEQLSCAYRYRPDMTPGKFNGVLYDGVMRDIVGNHVALVREGRAGPDVMVSDELPTELKTMKNPKLLAVLKPFLAADANLAALDAEMEKMKAEDGEVEDPNDTDAKSEAEARKAAKDKKAKDAKRARDKKGARDEDDMDDDEGAMDSEGNGDADEPKSPEGGAPKPGKDSATVTVADVQAAADAARAAAVAQMTELQAAKDAVAPFVGAVKGLDTAASVYEYALKQLGVDVAGVHASAYPAMLALARRAPAAKPAQDSAGAKSTSEMHPGLARIKHG